MRRALWMMPLLMVAPAAQASDFGCLAEWVNLSVWLLALPAALVVAVLCAWRSTAWRWVAGAGAMVALIVVATSCSYGNDKDAWTLVVVAAVVGVAALAAATREALTLAD